MSHKFYPVIQPVPSPKLQIVGGEVTLPSHARMFVQPLDHGIKIRFENSKTAWHDVYYLTPPALRKLSDFCLEAASIIEANKNV